MSQQPPVDTSKSERHPQPDATREEVLRADLVAHLSESGVLVDAAVERAMRSVPRHLFLPASSLAEAYADAAVATHWENEIAVSSASQPAIVALMLQQLQLSPGLRVLEIGAGTGYNAALLAALVAPGGSVTSVDIDRQIVEEARAHLAAAGVTDVAVHLGDGRQGWPQSAPFDRVLLTVGSDDIWPAWRDQLVESGLLVLPLELANGQASVAFRKRGEILSSESITPCAFMRLRGGQRSVAAYVSLADGRRLAGVRVSEIAESVSALLRMRPRVLVGRRLDASTLQRLGFALALRRGSPNAPGSSPLAVDAAPRLVTLFPRGFNGRGRRVRHGIYAQGADGPSLALFGSFLPFLFVFGGTAAERALDDALASDAQVVLPIERWRIEARPRDAVMAPVPPGARRLTRPHCIFDIWPNG